MSALARLKRAVRAAISANGGIDGAGATCGKARQTTGGWNNLNDASLPTVGDALALDEVAICATGRAPMLCAMAAELGHVVVPIPQAVGSHDQLVMQLAEATGEFGDIATALTVALADGKLDTGEEAAILLQIDEAQEALARLRGMVVSATEER
ncbi:MAG: hypothetical protein CL955_03945 [Erythrobacteraceae bacterium]|nr:hypothetical protein [Erythrobacteraceae bacterium]